MMPLLWLKGLQKEVKIKVPLLHRLQQLDLPLQML
jgi:hypothetical protein